MWQDVSFGNIAFQYFAAVLIMYRYYRDSVLRCEWGANNTCMTLSFDWFTFMHRHARCTLDWHLWFHAETLTSMKSFYSTKGPLYSLNNKGSLLASIVPWRTFNIHGSFPFHKRFFMVEDYWNVLHTKTKMVILGTVHLKVLWGTKNGSSME